MGCFKKFVTWRGALCFLSALLFLAGSTDLYMTNKWVGQRKQIVTIKTGSASWDYKSGVLVDANKEPILTYRSSPTIGGGEKNALMWRLMDAFGKENTLFCGWVVLAFFCFFFRRLARRSPQWPFRIKKDVKVYLYHWILWAIYVGFLVGHFYGIASFSRQYIPPLIKF